ncbi:MAG TPA: hypothetical protein VLT45_22940 [Kofleriaceae bacterium]|nr:hypothetical protein [Kofleriaceae bacterium]
MPVETLEDVLRLGHDLVEIIVQDEYTHDVVTRAPDAYRVYDTT